MSDKEVKNEKVVTKYDRKVQRREEEKAKEAKQKKITAAVSIVAVIALVAFIASFPIRTFIAQNETFITINGEEITRVEFDYYYNNVVNDYVNQYGAYLSYFGLDASKDFSTQMYDDNLTWKDYFDEMTVENMKSTRAIKAEADAAGFQYDSASEVEEFEKSIKEAAKTAQVSTKKYVKQLYGQYASLNILTDFVAQSARNNAYYDQIAETKKATDEEIEAYYAENAVDYDSVDYYVMEFPAEITAEEPTEEEIEAAMNAACDLADAARESVDVNGELIEGETYSEVAYAISDWLFDEARQNGDTEVIEDADSNTYYAVEFVNRYLNEDATANIRLMTLGEGDGQAVLDEWTAGAATEESFAELCKKYSEDPNTSANGGLVEGATTDSLRAELADWVFAEERSVGDTTTITIEGVNTYVLYYVGAGQPEWKVNIGNVLQSENMNEYLTAIAEQVVVEDSKGNLNYLKVKAQLEAEEAVSGGDVSGSDVSGSDAVSEGDVSAN